MTRLLFALVLAVALGGCGEEKKPDSPPPDASAFDKKEMPRDLLKGGGKKSGPQGN